MRKHKTSLGMNTPLLSCLSVRCLLVYRILSRWAAGMPYTVLDPWCGLWLRHITACWNGISTPERLVLTISLLSVMCERCGICHFGMSLPHSLWQHLSLYVAFFGCNTIQTEHIFLLRATYCSFSPEVVINYFCQVSSELLRTSCDRLLWQTLSRSQRREVPKLKHCHWNGVLSPRHCIQTQILMLTQSADYLHLRHNTQSICELCWHWCLFTWSFG